MIFNKKITPACKYCQHSLMLSFNNETLCKKRGFNSPDGSCIHYKYDALKREPTRMSINSDFNKEDFEI